MSDNIEDNRIPEPLRALLSEARATGHSVEVFEVDGNPLLPRCLVARAWVPWASDLGRRMKAEGARDGYMDQFYAETDEREQLVAWQEIAPEMPATFRLVRQEDATGVSGTGHVADGVLWHDGKVTIHWRTATSSTAVYDSFADAEKIHGHGGKTRVEWYPMMWRSPGGITERFHGNGAEIGKAFLPQAECCGPR